jgi:hypothetical protein
MSDQNQTAAEDEDVAGEGRGDAATENVTDRSSGIIEEMTVEDVERLDPEVVVIGFGSTEPHGPHLPYGTDVFHEGRLSPRGRARQ